MKPTFARCSGILLLSLHAFAARVPSAEHLLPADTWAVLSVPDLARARSAGSSNALGRLWADPAMRPFRENVSKAVQAELIEPLERELGVRFADYHSLIPGQLTLGLVRDRNAADLSTHWLLLADSGDKANDLSLQLTGLRRKWAASRHPLRTNSYSGTEFTTVTVSNASVSGIIQRALAVGYSDAGPATNTAPAKPAPAASHLEFTIGLSGSLLIVTSDTNSLQGVLMRQAGDREAATSDESVFRREFPTRFRDALGYAWVDLEPLMKTLVTWAKAYDQQTHSDDPKQPMPERAKLLAATGLTAARRLSFAWTTCPEGSLTSFDLDLPATNRSGVFKMIEFEARDSGPPPFVPAEVTEFQRWRLKLPQVWMRLEEMFTEVFPPARSVLNFLLQTAGKGADPGYDLKTEILDSLGDDVISYELPLRTNALADLEGLPSLSLLGSTNSQRLVSALRTTAALLPPPLTDVSEREIQGRRVYSLGLPSLEEVPEDHEREPTLTFGAVTNFVAFSTDLELLEHFLGGTNTPSATLRDRPGLTEAAAKVGGFDTGFFAFEDTAARMRGVFRALRSHPKSALALIPPEWLLAITGLRLEEPLQRILGRCEFGLLPEYAQVEKYFHFSVSSGIVDAEALRYRRFSPVPPALVEAIQPPPVQSPNK